MNLDANLDSKLKTYRLNKKEYEQIKFSKREVQVTKELNRILETTVDNDKKIYDTILGYLKEVYADYKEARRREKFLKSGQGRKFLDSL